MAVVRVSRVLRVRGRTSSRDLRIRMGNAPFVVSGVNSRYRGMFLALMGKNGVMHPKNAAKCDQTQKSTKNAPPRCGRCWEMGSLWEDQGSLWSGDLVYFAWK